MSSSSTPSACTSTFVTLALISSESGMAWFLLYELSNHLVKKPQISNSANTLRPSPDGDLLSFNC